MSADNWIYAYYQDIKDGTAAVGKKGFSVEGKHIHALLHLQASQVVHESREEIRDAGVEVPQRIAGKSGVYGDGHGLPAVGKGRLQGEPAVQVGKGGLGAAAKEGQTA